MKNAMTEEQSNFLKMENGKKDLPVGITKTQFGSYRLQRTVNNQKYRFGSIQSLDLALRVNAGIDDLVKDLRIALESPSGVTAEQVKEIVAENSLIDQLEVTRQIQVLASMIKSQNDLIIGQADLLHEHISDKTEERKSLWQRITGQ